eukprot:TRINITY_DN14254_c0_g1_i2.p2 TRINITY_DN14254_c0_g1~~TRINITY_DN14254_c0_g1_i2.p2  ORF type:complete len:246 (+),score=68.05 TRINITY_DN14254_c0_g1_i2:92-739(+)
MARTESSEDRRARRARMEVTLDNWLIKYSSTADALGFQIADASHIAYDNITAAQNEENYRRRAQGATHVWLVSVRGHVVRPGVFFEGRFTLKYEPVDGEFRIRKEHFAVTEQANPLPVTMGRPDEPFGLEFSVQGGIVTADQVQSGPLHRAGLPQGCRIVSFDGRLVSDLSSMRAATMGVRERRATQFMVEWLPQSQSPGRMGRRHLSSSTHVDC